jgi:RNA polymerase sigma factor (sigma-70 family)
MRTMPRGLASREFDSLFRHGVTTGLTDKELLERFTACRDQGGELAFATLVGRHGPMVLNVCRRMLCNPADAEDAFQATFLVLVRKARGIRFGTSLGPWLYGVSIRVARRVRNVGARRRLVVLDAAIAEVTVESGSIPDRDLRFAIDEALASLPANYREAIVLCYLEGLTHEAAAKRLQCPVGTIRSRLARGRALLKHQLERSGLGPPEPSTRSQKDSSKAVVASHLIDTTARTASRLAAGQPLAEAVPARLAELVAGVTRTMTITKLSLAATLLVGIGLTTWGAVGLAAQASDRREVAAPPAAVNAEPPLLALAAIEAPADSSEESTTEREQQPANQPDPDVPDDIPPVVVNVEPKVGATDVDPKLSEIRVTFSKKMTDKSWSWTEGNVYAIPKVNGTVHYEKDKRTCVMPVKLEPGKTYVLGINSERHRNFKDAKGRPALPYLVVFHTKATK